MPNRYKSINLAHKPEIAKEQGMELADRTQGTVLDHTDTQVVGVCDIVALKNKHLHSYKPVLPQ